MSQSMCKQHRLPLNRICASASCHAQLCHSCFGQHSKETRHETAVLLDSSTLDFFVAFLEFLTHQLINWVIQVNHNGFDVLIKNSRSHLYWPSAKTREGPNQICIEAIEKYKEMLTKNADFVSANKHNFPAIENAEFFKDLCSYVLQDWKGNSMAIVDSFKEGVTKSYPYLVGLKEAEFILDPTFLQHIEKERQSLLLKKCKRSVLTYKNGVIYQKAETVPSTPTKGKDEQVANKRQTRTAVKKFSIVEVLNCEKFEMPVENTRDISEEQDEERGEISPEVVPYQSLNKLIQELMIENEKLKLENTTLKTDNQALKRQNESLKGKTVKSTRSFARLLYPINGHRSP